MPNFETVYLAMVVCGFLAFMVTLAYGSFVTWQMQKLEQSNRPDKPDQRNAA